MVQVYLKIISLFKKALQVSCAVLLSSLLIVVNGYGQESEVERLGGFKTFKKESSVYDREREKGYAAYLENLEKEAFEKKKALQEHRKSKKEERPLEETKYYTEYKKDVLEDQQDYEDSLKAYMAEKKKWSSAKFKRPFSEEFELDILSDRPRYEYKKRAMYGAKPKYKPAPSANTGSSSGGYVPPPPDFGGDGGFIPPPPPPPPPFEPMDEIPPPPPMPMDGLGDFNNNDGFIPPPPPPPPMFDGEF